jgi:superfamily II DNA or RNA helicase
MMPRDPSRANPAGAVVPFAQEDLIRIFDAKTIQRARHLIMLGAVELSESETRIEATVSEAGSRLDVAIVPMRFGQRVLFDRSCSCGRSVCAHTAAAAMLTLDTRPEWRRQGMLFARLDRAGAPPPTPRAEAPPPPPQRPPPPRSATPLPIPAIPRGNEPRVAVWTIEPGGDAALMYVTAFLARIGRDGRPEAEGVPATLSQVLERTARTVQGDVDRSIAKLLGAGSLIRTPIAKDKRHLVDAALKRLLAGGRLRWRDGRALAEAPRRVIRAVKDLKTGKIRPIGLPEGGALIKGESWWCIDPKAGRAGPAELQLVAAASVKPPPAPTRPAETRREPAPPPRPSSTTAEIVDRTPRIVLRLGRVATQDAGLLDVIHLVFDYGDPGHPAEIEADDQRQFAKLVSPVGKAAFARRDRRAEQAILDRLAAAGFSQFRMAPAERGGDEKGLRLHALRGRDAAERWSEFLKRDLPALEEAGCEIVREADFGAEIVEPDGEVALGVADAGEGWFDLEVGIEIEGVRRSLLPILARLIEAGGMDAARVVDGKVLTVLEDGRALALPADRVAQLMSVLEGMLDNGRPADGKLRVPLEEADTLLDIDELVERKGEASRITMYLARLRGNEAPLPEHPEPALFRGELRHYQRQGLAWLQKLRANGLSGCLGDDMGLGKTAQTIAHIALEYEMGRLADPALVVVPTSLVPNWRAELARFAPHLKTVIMHGLERHQRRDEIEAAQIVITTYAILARDVDALTARRWSIVVLDEAQAIKNPDAKATRAACSLEAGQRLCLSGTPVENNLGEVWSQFAFLMPGLLGDRKSFQKRYRTPIEKRGDATRAAQFSRRIRPFLLRRTKAEVAADLPPKTEVVRRIELDTAQRDLYEAIRLSVHERVREAIAASGLARNQITVLDALLKLRQACCDPRLVKLEAARAVTESTKLAALVEMLEEMVPEGSRILVFSQFTSMLDLIKPELDRAQIPYVELTGSTSDRETPVKLFQAGAVPVFLLSLKAGGRGLNLTAADTVIHYDPWWNPAAEAQATDRAHRIGQDKPVFVYKLIAAGTVEEKIVELQRRKASLADAVISGGELAGALTDEDVNYLFAAEEG